MKLIILLLISFSAVAQTTNGKKVTTTEWWALSTINPTVIVGKGVLILHVEPIDTATYIYTLSRRKKVWITTPDVVSSIDNTDARNVYTPVAGWFHATNQTWTQTYHNKTGSYTGAANASFETTFDGYKVEFWSEKRLNHGIAAISIDGGPEVMVDLYDPTTNNNSQKVWTSPDMTNGTKKIKIRVTGNKYPSATEASVIIDRLVVYKK